MNPHQPGWYWVKSKFDSQPGKWQVKWFSGTRWNIYIPQSNEEYERIFELGPYLGLEPAPVAAPPVVVETPLPPVAAVPISVPTVEAPKPG